MSDAPGLPPELDAELDEVLSLLPLLGAVPSLADRIFDRLTTTLAAAVLHDVRARRGAGELSRTAYLAEVCQVVVQLQDRGLLRPDQVRPMR
ncbi:MAG TPA: hypothetical protein VEW93_15105 [Acidimicrobiales bacterium]|nr:hypothetical protein [Acidimicrobiales bacterium]